MTDEPPSRARLTDAVEHAIRKSGFSVDQVATMSGIGRKRLYGWLGPRRNVQVDDVWRIEETLGLERGELLATAGYVSPPRGLEGLIRRDPLLDAPERATVLSVLQALRASVAQRRAQR